MAHPSMVATVRPAFSRYTFADRVYRNKKVA
jgi:hypothetical protein